MADMTVNESAEAPRSEKLSTSMQRLLDELSTQHSHQCEFVMMLEMADFGAKAEALAFAMFESIRESSDAADRVQMLIDRVRILEVAHV